MWNREDRRTVKSGNRSNSRRRVKILEGSKILHRGNKEESVWFLDGTYEKRVYGTPDKEEK